MPETIRVTDEDRQKFIVEQFPLLVEQLKLLVTKFWPDKLNTIVIESQEEGIVGFDSIINIEPSDFVTKSIRGFVERMGWLVSTWKTSHGDHWTPPDVDQVELAHCDGIPQTLQQFAQHYFRLVHVEPYFDHLADQAYAKQIEEEQDWIAN